MKKKKAEAETEIKVVIGGTYCKYDGQNRPQRSMLELDCEKAVLRTTFNPSVGVEAVSSDVWHGHVKRWDIAALLPHVCRELCDEVLPLCRTIIDGYEGVWDGNNYVAKFTEEAQDAKEAVERICRSDDYTDGVWQEIDVYEFCEEFCEAEGIEMTRRTTKKQIDKIIADIEASVPDGWIVDDIAGYTPNVSAASSRL